MAGYSLRNSKDPNELIIYCHQCKETITADRRMGKNLKIPKNMCWSGDPPTQDSLLWDKVITNHRPQCAINKERNDLLV